MNIDLIDVRKPKKVVRRFSWKLFFEGRNGNGGLGAWLIAWLIIWALTSLAIAKFSDCPIVKYGQQEVVCDE